MCVLVWSGNRTLVSFSCALIWSGNRTRVCVHVWSGNRTLVSFSCALIWSGTYVLLLTNMSGIQEQSAMCGPEEGQLFQEQDQSLSVHLYGLGMSLIFVLAQVTGLENASRSLES